ncbi:MAG: type IV pili methyl-accepting chemotaxis transducer N-terminal domain-containing protein [Pseudomonadota bacterium]
MNAWQPLASGKTLSTKVVGALLAFLALALLAIGSTLYLSWQLEGSAAAINDTGSVRMRSYRLNTLFGHLANDAGPGPARAAIAQQLDLIDATLAQLDQGDPQRPLFLPSTPRIRVEFDLLVRDWQTQLRPAAVGMLSQPGIVSRPAWQGFEAQAERFAADVDALVRLVERDSERRTLWLRGSQLVLLALALLGTLGIIALMHWLILGPVTRLNEGMARMKECDFGVRLPAGREDEFGQLARAFNDMADRLTALYRDLEARVLAKTASLEEKNRELAMLYDSSAFLRDARTVDALCDGMLARICTYFGADGGAVRVFDAVRGNVHLVSHQGLSARLSTDEHCMKVGQCLCGEAAGQAQMVLHDLRGHARKESLQCYREGFESVSVLPIRGHTVLGFFNLHFRQARVLAAREQALLETLGQLLGVALEHLRLAAREREMAVSEERNLMAQGLHDSIAQGLNYLNLQVQMLDESVREARGDEVAAILPNLRSGLNESYDDVRELLHNFRTRLKEGDLVASIDAALEKFRRQTGINAELAADIDGAPFPPEQQLQLLFIVQEALSNIRKHAHASKVEVCLHDGPDFELTIRDNGIGFDAANMARQGERHVGMHIMQERAQRIAADFQVASTPGSGTVVALQLHHTQRCTA